jgi:hypothetical protein
MEHKFTLLFSPNLWEESKKNKKHAPRVKIKKGSNALSGMESLYIASDVEKQTIKRMSTIYIQKVRKLWKRKVLQRKEEDVKDPSFLQVCIVPYLH